MAEKINLSSGFPLEQIRVLVVDNDERLSHIIKEILHVFGFKEIHLAYSGEDAMKMMSEGSYDLIILDWVMEPMDGIEFTEHIRQDEFSPNPVVPIIMITGRAEIADVQLARDTGVTEFMAKPFSVEDLRRRIISVVDKPRSFVFTEEFTGPDRRRHKDAPPDGVERRKNDPNPFVGQAESA